MREETVSRSEIVGCVPMEALLVLAAAVAERKNGSASSSDSNSGSDEENDEFILTWLLGLLRSPKTELL